MNKQYLQLMEDLFSQFGMALQTSEDDIYCIEVDDRFQIMIGLHEDRWVQLFCQLDRLLPPSNNLFGQSWPAHVQGQLDNKSIIWSQQPLEGIGLQEMQAWLKRFIDDVEQSLNSTNQDVGINHSTTVPPIGVRV